MHRAKLAFLATLLVAASDVAAQSTLAANSRVRVVSWNGQRVIGRLAKIRGDTLIVVQDGLLWNPTYRIPVDRATRVEVSRGKYVHPARVIGGALLGAAAGVLTVHVVPGLTKTRCSADVCGTSSAVGEGMVIGAAAGVVLGVLTPADRWEAVPKPVRLGLGGDARQARLGVSLSF